MVDDLLDEEMSIMYEEPGRSKTLDSAAFLMPIKNLKVRKPAALGIDRTVQDALDLMKQKRVSCILITERERLAGILTERDIVARALQTEKPLGEIGVALIMTPHPESYQPEDSLAFVLNAMHVGGYRHVPIIDDDERPVAVISAKDIISFIVEHFSEEVLNLPPRPIRSTGEREGA